MFLPGKRCGSDVCMVLQGLHTALRAAGGALRLLSVWGSTGAAWGCVGLCAHSLLAAGAARLLAVPLAVV